MKRNLITTQPSPRSTLSIVLLGLSLCFSACTGSGSGGNGSPTFSKSFGSSGDDAANKAIATADGGYLLTGIYGASFDPIFDGGDEGVDGTTGNLWVMKLDAYGDVEWNRTLGAVPPTTSPYLKFQLARKASDGVVWAAYSDFDPNQGAPLTGNYLQDGGNAVIARYDANGVQEWIQTFDIGTIPGLPFADNNATALETATDILPLANGNLRVAATVHARVLTTGGPRGWDALWLFDLSPTGNIVWEDLRLGSGNYYSYLPGNSWITDVRLMPLGNGSTFVISSGVETVIFLNSYHAEPITEISTIDALGAEIARTRHDILVLAADVWALTTPVGLPGGILLGNDGGTNDYDDWRAIELDALGAEVDHWDVPGNHQTMTVAANASQGGAGPAGLFFWIGKDHTLESYAPGGTLIASNPLLDRAEQTYYDELQDTLKSVSLNSITTLDRNFSVVGTANFNRIDGSWSGPGGLLLDTGQVLEKVDSNGNSIGSVARETDNLVGEVGIDCLQRSSGNYVISGRLPYNPENLAEATWHSWIIEMDAYGNVQWQNSAPADTTDGYFGAPLVQGPQDLVVGLGGGRSVEVQGVGTLSQTSELLGRSVRALAAVPEGGYIAAAWADSNENFDTDDFEVIRMGADLSTTWIREIQVDAPNIFGGALVNAPKSIVPVEDGFLIGTTLYVLPDAKLGITKIGLDGSFVGCWTYELANQQTVGPTLLVPSSDGGFLIAASVAETGNTAGFSELYPSNGLAIQLDDQLQPIRYTLYGGAESEYFQSVEALEDGYLFAGNSLSLGERSEAWILRTDLDCSVSAGCVAVIAQGPWPLDATFETRTGLSVAKLPAGTPGIPTESAVFTPPIPVTNTVVARQCSGTAAPLDPGTQPEGTFVLTIRHQGLGAGSVVSNPAGIDCGSTCEFAFAAGTTVFLTPIVEPGSFFSHWGGVDIDFGIEGAQVVMNANRTVDIWIE